MSLQDSAFDELSSLVTIGPRFHGTAGIDAANAFLRERLDEMGLTVSVTKVRTPGWTPGSTASLEVIAPVARSLVCWPMLWSGSSPSLTARLRPHGSQGLWADAMTWTKFAVVDDEDRAVAYIHGRDVGPAAPQPLPIGSDESVPHLAIGRIDAMQLSEWMTDGHEVRVTLQADCTHSGEAESENLSVQIPGRSDEGPVLICGHYDTFWNTPGAYDNGSGTIALLLLATELLRNPPARPVNITFFTAEEWHLAGSRLMVTESHSEQLDALDFVINLDGLGRGDFLELFVGPERFEERVSEEIRNFGTQTRDALEVHSRFPPTYGTDHAAFYAAGVPSAHLTFNDLHRLHQPDDLPNREIAANIAWTVELVRELVERIERPERARTRSITMPF